MTTELTTVLVLIVMATVRLGVPILAIALLTIALKRIGASVT